MKIRKVQAALKKAQAVQRSNKTAFEAINNRARVAKDSLAQAKAGFKVARKEVKQARKQSALVRIAQKTAKRSYRESVAAVEKLTRKLERAQKKTKPAKPTTGRTGTKKQGPKSRRAVSGAGKSGRGTVAESGIGLVLPVEAAALAANR